MQIYKKKVLVSNIFLPYFREKAEKDKEKTNKAKVGASISSPPTFALSISIT